LNAEDYEGTSIDCSFLGHMNKLLDFSILVPARKEPGTGQEFLAALPVNQLKKLRLWSLNSETTLNCSDVSEIYA